VHSLSSSRLSGQACSVQAKTLHTNTALRLNALYRNGDTDKIHHRKILLLTAHPDDECMFFGPALVGLLAADNEVTVLCISDGDADGMGKVRRSELVQSCALLGIDREKVHIAKNRYGKVIFILMRPVTALSELQDGMANEWDEHLLCIEMEKIIKESTIDTVKRATLSKSKAYYIYRYLHSIDRACHHIPTTLRFIMRRDAIVNDTAPSQSSYTASLLHPSFANTFQSSITFHPPSWPYRGPLANRNHASVAFERRPSE